MYLVKRPLSYGGYLAYRYCKEKEMQNDDWWCRHGYKCVNDDSDIPIIEAKAMVRCSSSEGYLQGGRLWLLFYNMKSLITMCAAKEFHSYFCWCVSVS
jgi:hypothetical protein